MGLKKIIGEAVKCTVYASTGIAMYKAMNNKLAEHEKIEKAIQEERQAKNQSEKLQVEQDIVKRNREEIDELLQSDSVTQGQELEL